MSALIATLTVSILCLNPWRQTSPQEAPTSQPTEGRPTTAPADPATGLVRPKQAAEVTELLQRTEYKPVELVAPVELRGTAEANAGLLPEGTMQIDRPGRLERQQERSHFVFVPTGGSEQISLEVNRNQLLELMEREAQNGTADFVISGEVTIYRGANYLTLRKLVKRVSNGNLSP